MLSLYDDYFLYSDVNIKSNLSKSLLVVNSAYQVCINDKSNFSTASNVYTTTNKNQITYP